MAEEASGDSVRALSRAEALHLRSLRRMILLRPGLTAAALASAVASAVLSLLLPLVIRRLVDSVSGSQQPHDVWRSLQLLALIYAGYAVATGLQDYVTASLGHWIAAQLRSRAVRSLLATSLGSMRLTARGDMLARLSADINSVQWIVSQGLGTIMQQPVAMVIGLLLLARVNLTMAACVLLAIVVSVAVGAAVGRPIRRLSGRTHRLQGAALALLSEALSSFLVVKAYGLEGRVQETYEPYNRGVTELGTRIARIRAVLTGGIAASSSGLTIAIVAIGIYAAAAGRGSVGDLVAGLLYAQLVLAPLRLCAYRLAQMKELGAALDRVDAVIDMEPELRSEVSGAVLPVAHLGDLVLESVDFSYDAVSPVLTDVSLCLPAGSTTVIMGDSGSGKSTLVALLCRLFAPTGGSITAGGRDLRRLDGAGYRARVGLMGQESLLFDMSIRENIRVGYPAATDEQVLHAARLAHADDFINRLPQRFDTRIGEDGCLLSGGERQRLCLARALVREPELLILDEPMSALDRQTATELRASLAEARRGRTCVIISHDASATDLADQVVILRQGQVQSVECQWPDREALAGP